MQLILVNKRKTDPHQNKSIKDRAQAAFLIRALAQDRPEELREAYEVALASGPRWGKRNAASLKRIPKTAARLANL